MVFTVAQTTAFFEDAAQMGIPNATRIQLQVEGIDAVSDLSEFDSEDLKQIADNLRRPSGRVPVDPNNPNGPTIPTPPFEFGAKSLNRLKSASDIVRYYETIDRPLTHTNMHWSTIKIFNEHWKSLKSRKADDRPETPKITRGLPVVKWTEAFEDFLNRIIGGRYIPLAYVIRRDVDVPTAPTLQTVATQLQPFCEEHGSVEHELIARASHTHPLYRDDNAEVYYEIEESTRGTGYAASIKPFQRRKDGRGAYYAMLNQYAGEDKWRALVKEAEDLLHNRRWKGQQTNYSLEKFIGQHRAAFVNLSQCETHIAYQLPNEISRVNYLLSGIECMSAPLQAAMALVRNDTGPTGKLNDFEATSAFLLPHDPVANKRSGTKREREAQISEVDVDTSKEHEPKPRIGKTGVELRFHTGREYFALSDEQRKELSDYRDAREAKGLGRNLPKNKRKRPAGPGRSNRKPTNKKMKTMIAAAVASALKTRSDEAADVASVDKDFESYVASIVEKSSTSAKKPKKVTISETTAAPTDSDKAPAITLASIVSRIKK